MSDVNKYTEQALERYVQMENPQFAVLINGEWGTGKTWFVKNFFATHEFPKKFCYISLFDIKSVREIDAALIEQITRFTGSKCIRIASKITRFAIEKYTGYDIQQIEDFGTKISKKIPNGVIICLDDIERSRLSIKTILGYTSNLLEQFESNVILISNKSKIKKQNDFNEAIEKVIGIQLTINEDITSFIAYSTEYIQNYALKLFLLNNSSIIIEYFNHYNTHSLRYIRILIHYFEALYSATDHKENENYVKSLLVSLCDVFFRRFVSVSQKDDLESVQYVGNIYLKNDILRRHSILCPILSNDLTSFWDDFFKNGKIDSNIIKLDFDNSLYNTKNKNTPIRLWNYYFLDDDFVLSTYKTMCLELENNEYTSIDIFLHAVGIMLEMIEINIEQRCIDFDYFKKIINNTEFIIDQETLDKFSFPGYSSFEYKQAKSEMFIKVRDYVLDRYSQLGKDKRTDIFNYIIKNINKSNHSDSIKKLRDKNFDVNLEQIDSDSIIESILIHKNSTLTDIMDLTTSIIINNHTSPFFNKWATNLLVQIEQKAEDIKHTHKIKFMTLGRIIGSLKKYITQSKEYIE